MIVTSAFHPPPLTLVTHTFTSDLCKSFCPPPLKKHQVHLWVASLPFLSPLIPQMFQFLSRRDHQKAQHFFRDEDQRRALVSRGVLRCLLGGYLGSSPRQLHLAEGPYGKPGLRMAEGGACLSFNVSHSSDLLLFAFSRYSCVGADVERVRLVDDALSVADAFFHPVESAWLRRVHRRERLAAFFDLWTRKEAYVKATGEGLSCSLESFSVGEGTDADGYFRVSLPDRGDGVWATGLSFAPAQGYSAAVVAF